MEICDRQVLINQMLMVQLIKNCDLPLALKLMPFFLIFSCMKAFTNIQGNYGHENHTHSSTIKLHSLEIEGSLTHAKYD